MRFGDIRANEVKEDETGLADALALAVTLIPEPETMVVDDPIKWAVEHGVRVVGARPASIPDTEDDASISLWEDDYGMD